MSDVTDFDLPSQEDVRGDLRSVFRGAIRMTLETLLEDEIREMVGGSRWARIGGRKDRRNGSYLRGLITSMGYLDVEVPRSRESGSAVGVIGRYERRMPEIDEAIVTSYVNGVSTRKMGTITEALTGEHVGKSTVSRITRQLELQTEGLQSRIYRRGVPIGAEGPVQWSGVDAPASSWKPGKRGASPALGVVSARSWVPPICRPGTNTVYSD